jgi:hypothetical protein
MRNLLFLVIGLLLVAAAPANASDVVLTWVAPTTNTDGSTPAAIGGYNVYRSLTSAIVAQKAGGAAPLAGGSGSTIAKTVLTYTDKNVPPGTYYYGVTAWYCDPTPVNGCTESAVTVSVPVTIVVVKTAGKPGTITVTVNGVKVP